jgi:hypothetical protein
VAKEFAVAIAMTMLPSFLSAESRLAPPAKPEEFARTASAIVIGRFVSQAADTFTPDVRQIPAAALTYTVDTPAAALTFTVDNVIKAHANAPLHPRATLASQPPPDQVTILWADCPECDIQKVRFEQGKSYLLFIVWNRPFDVYSLHYSNAGAFRLDRDAVVPMEDGTDLARNAKSVSKAMFLSQVRAGSQKP